MPLVKNKKGARKAYKMQQSPASWPPVPVPLPTGNLSEQLPGVIFL